MNIYEERGEDPHPDKPEQSLIHGRMMAVDWADGTARLDTLNGESIKLRFSTSDIDMENRMRKHATCHIEVRANRISADDGEEYEVVRPYDIVHSLLEPIPPREDVDGPLADEEMDEWIRAIYEGRAGLCGECRYRLPLKQDKP